MSCCICSKSKTTLICGACKQDVCKSCTEFLDNDTFSFLTKPAAFLTEKAFCSTCFIESVNPELVKYNDTIEKAKNILVFEISQGKETRLIKRKEATLKVHDCADRSETIMRLAFQAVELGFNSIIDVDVKPKKIINGTYQHTIYNGTAIPAQVSDNKLVKDRSIWSNPN